jgi:hypothetical protein
LRARARRDYYVSDPEAPALWASASFGIGST